MKTQTVKHIVMWKVHGHTPEEKLRSAELVKSRFEGLIGRIPGLQRLEVGIDCSHASYACDAVLYSEFTTQEALAAYATHPEHLRVRSELANVRIERHQVDYLSEGLLSG